MQIPWMYWRLTPEALAPAARKRAAELRDEEREFMPSINDDSVSPLSLSNSYLDVAAAMRQLASRIQLLRERAEAPT